MLIWLAIRRSQVRFSCVAPFFHSHSTRETIFVMRVTLEKWSSLKGKDLFLSSKFLPFRIDPKEWRRQKHFWQELPSLLVYAFPFRATFFSFKTSPSLKSMCSLYYHSICGIFLNSVSNTAAGSHQKNLNEVVPKGTQNLNLMEDDNNDN